MEDPLACLCALVPKGMFAQRSAARQMFSIARLSEKRRGCWLLELWHSVSKTVLRNLSSTAGEGTWSANHSLKKIQDTTSHLFRNLQKGALQYILEVFNNNDNALI